jgi:KaiC/GvpD/RAD55 family RecA-like ATPase
MSKRTLRFGINGLDDLLSGSYIPGKDEVLGIDISAPSGGDCQATSVCIVGPNGTGKSVFALHLASYFAAGGFQSGGRCRAPKVLYASTDLRYPKAQKIWHHFMLDFPLARPIPFNQGWFAEIGDRTFEGEEKRKVKLSDFVPIPSGQPPDGNLADFVAKKLDEPEVAFVDLAAHTAGDDWNFVDRLISVLDRCTFDEPHLLVVDAVEGLQTLVGEVDEFGEPRSRRSRVAQLLRTAAEKCHVVFVVEEADDKARLPEDYVADVVFRLRSAEHSHGGRSYLRRTVEIEKARAQAHVRGQHTLVIRDGRGSQTGKRYNPDDPPVVIEFHKGKPSTFVWKKDVFVGDTKIIDGSIKRADRKRPLERVAYVNVIPSLDFVSRREQGDNVVTGKGGHKRAGFGIHYLDDMLTKPKEESGPNGLAFGSLTAIIGENGTHRNRVANAFLSQGFVVDNEDGNNVAIVITTDNTDSDELAEKFKSHLPLQTRHRVNPENIVCRRLEVHDLTAAGLFHIIDSAMHTARSIARPKGLIRMVISNLELMRATYPEVIDDPLFLPSLKRRIRQVEVTTLVVHTDPAGPDRSRQNALSQVLRSDLASHIIYTWNVAFFGEERVAIMVPTTGFSDSRRPVVREIRGSDEKNDQQLVVDPHFELYTGLLERGEVQMIPLQVRLWGHSQQFTEYVKEVRALLDGVFQKDERSESIVHTGTEIRYEDIRSASNFKGGVGLNSTAILQVDEFWHVHHQELQTMERYLFGETVENGLAVLTTDPYKVFQFTGSDISTRALFNRRRIKYRELCRKYRELRRAARSGEEQRIVRERKDRLGGLMPNPKSAIRSEFFVLHGHSYDDAERLDEIDRVPYFWDFGFLMLRQSLWEVAAEKRFSVLDQSDPTKLKSVTVKSVYDRLCAPSRHGARSTAPVSWRDFLNACTIVARTAGLQSDGTVPPFFDLDMMAAESLCCFVLEVWASTIAEMEGLPINKIFAPRRSEPGLPGLVDLLKDYREAFFRTWLLIGETMSAKQLGIDWYLPEVRRANPKAVASRHWYASACAIDPPPTIDDPLLPVRMPGRFSVRGDWFLAIAAGSRSKLLGERAIDILSTRKANLERLKRGIGLPTRDCGNEDGIAATLNETRTRLQIRKGDRMEPMRYGDVRKLGADDKPDKEGFYWLWRYTIRDYDRQSPVFAQMLAYMLKRCPEYWDNLVRDGAGFRSAFDAYDLLSTKPAVRGAGGYSDFENDCNLWIERLRNSSISTLT